MVILNFLLKLNLINNKISYNKFINFSDNYLKKLFTMISDALI